MPDGGGPAARLGRLSRSPLLLPARTGTVWVVVALALPRIVGAALTLALRRFLGPFAAGTFDLAFTPYRLLDTFRSFGTGPALIFEPEMTSDLADTAWTINMAAAILVTALAQILARPAALYYGHLVIEGIVRVLSIAYVFSSLSSVHYFLLLRDLNFRDRSIPPVGQVVVAGIVAILFALWGFGVGSLVAREVASAASGAVLLWAVHPFRPRIRLVWPLARHLLSYGSWVGAGLALLYVSQNVDLFVGGRVIHNSGDIGFYSTSWTLAFLMAGILTVLSGNVVFPTLSRLQHDRPAMRRKLLHGLQQVALLMCPAGALLACVAPVAIVPLLGGKFFQYQESFVVLSMLAVYSAIRTLLAVFFEGYKAVGKPWIVPAYNAAKLAVLLPCMVAGAHHGIVGLALAYVPIICLEIPAALYLVGRVLQIRPGQVWSSVRSPIVCTVLMAAAAIAVQTEMTAVTHGNRDIVLLLTVPVAIACYVLLMRLLDRNLLHEARIVLLSGL